MSIKRQKGLSLLGLLTTILVVGVLLIIGIRAVPFYLDDYAVEKVVTSLENRPDIESAGVREVREWLNKGLQTNRIELGKDEVKVFRDRSTGVTVEINYERRFHVLHNIDLVLTFEHDWNAESQ